MSFFKRLMPLKAQMNMNLENVSVMEGSPFKGSAVLTSDEAFQVETVRIEIRVWEKYREDRWVVRNNQNIHETEDKRDARYSQDVAISQPFSAAKGSRMEYPFEVTMPRYVPARNNGAIIYSLKAVANVKGRPDVTKEVNPMIIPAPPELLVARELNPTIKVKCGYCGNTVIVTPGREGSDPVLRCPSCGGPLTMPGQ